MSQTPIASTSVWRPTDLEAIDTQLAGLGPEQLQAPIETRRKAVPAYAFPTSGAAGFPFYPRNRDGSAPPVLPSRQLRREPVDQKDQSVRRIALR